MGQHKLSPGIYLIHLLAQLGDALGYEVDREFPVEADNPGGPALDLVWRRDLTPRAPLFVFEIESGESPRVAFNALKVLGQSSTTVPRPLFFFHILLESAPKSAIGRIMADSFQTQSYRVYHLGRNDASDLFRDIFTQHRRVFSELDLPALLPIFDGARRFGLNSDLVLLSIEELKFRADYLSAYFELSLSDPPDRSHLLRIIAQDPVGGVLQSKSPYCYFGDWWSELLHIALLNVLSPASSLENFEKLRKWQESFGPLTGVGPHFGLSQTYDQFLTVLAPSLLALIAGAFIDSRDAIRWIGGELAAIVRAVLADSVERRLFGSLWLLHIAAAGNDPVLFDEFRGIINDIGGVTESVLVSPPGMLHDSEAEEPRREGVTRVRVPPLSIFNQLLESSIGTTPRPVDALHLLYGALFDQEAALDWGPQIARLLTKNHVLTPLVI